VTSSLDDIRATWDAEAADYDSADDHGLHDPAVRDERYLVVSGR
jgi:hypothetical protein